MRWYLWFVRRNGGAPAAGYAAEVLYANALPQLGARPAPTVLSCTGSGYREVPDAAAYLKRFYTNQDC